MANINFEIVGAKDTVNKLIAMHRDTMKRIEGGEVFHKGLRNVTKEVYVACSDEIRQCLTVLDALDHMNAGNVSRARKLLDQIKEFIPHD